MKTTEKILQLSSIAMIMVACVSCVPGKIISSISKNPDVTDTSAHILAIFYDKNGKELEKGTLRVYDYYNPRGVNFETAPTAGEWEKYHINSKTNDTPYMYDTPPSTNSIRLFIKPGYYGFMASGGGCSGHDCKELHTRYRRLAPGDTLKLIFYMRRDEGTGFNIL